MSERERGLLAGAPLAVHAAVSAIANARFGGSPTDPQVLATNTVIVNGKRLSIRHSTVTDDADGKSVTAEERAVAEAVVEVAELVSAKGIKALSAYHWRGGPRDVTLKAMFRGVTPLRGGLSERVLRALVGLRSFALGS